jgi:hypothetical protein
MFANSGMTLKRNPFEQNYQTVCPGSKFQCKQENSTRAKSGLNAVVDASSDIMDCEVFVPTAKKDHTSGSPSPNDFGISQFHNNCFFDQPHDEHTL